MGSARLADARFANQHYQAALPSQSVVTDFSKLAHFVLAAYEDTISAIPAGRGLVWLTFVARHMTAPLLGQPVVVGICSRLHPVGRADLFVDVGHVPPGGPFGDD